MKLLLNCDLGEWETAAETRNLMACIDLANIACGGHAGSADSIRYCTQQAHIHSVKVGMHPGLPGNKGRSNAEPSPKDFRSLLQNQYANFSTASGDAPYHIKLHGSLYHMVETSTSLNAFKLS